jgi:hypothetical protein
LSLVNSSASAPGSNTLSISASTDGNPQLYQNQNFVTASSSASYGMASLPITVVLGGPNIPIPPPIATPSPKPNNCFTDFNYSWALFCTVSANTPVTLPIWTFAIPPKDTTDGNVVPDQNGEACDIQSTAWVYPIASPFTASATPGPGGPQQCQWTTKFAGSVTVQVSESAGTTTQLLRLNTTFQFLDPDDQTYKPSEYLSTLPFESKNGYEISLACNTASIRISSRRSPNVKAAATAAATAWIPSTTA